ncbi:MAG: AAA family ATPase [Alphaproteobacteria bacterium]|nr:AAA family ATPase [Alphaproteobacteria bacterium]
MQATTSQNPIRRGHIIVTGNEKGGSGKTTTTVHLIVALLRLGFRVGSMDIDARQRSLTRYFENRKVTIAKENTPLPMPHHIVVNKSPFPSQSEAEADDRDRFTRALAKLLVTCDFVVIDSPGNDTYLSRLAHSFADTVITPINDSFVDLDVLATVDGSTLEVQRPSIYSEMLWEQKMMRAKRDGGSIDWVVMRNRLSNIDARNKRMITQVMESLAKRIGFRQAPGFSERVIFREMFLLGLTVLDVTETNGASSSLSMSHLAARQEVRELLKALKIPAIDQRITEVRTGEVKPVAPTPPPEAANDSSPLPSEQPVAVEPIAESAA